MRNFRCSDAGHACDFVARGADDREVVDVAMRHGREAHGLARTPELEQRVIGLIHDDESDDRRNSMGSMIP
jgi:predicted small metal-binding protein